MMLHGLGRPVNNPDIENSQCYTTWEIADILKISKLSTESHFAPAWLCSSLDVWVPYKLSENLLTLDLHAIRNLNVIKTHFKTICYGQLKMDTLQ